MQILYLQIKKLFADSQSANKELFADSQSANKKLFADTQSANECSQRYINLEVTSTLGSCKTTIGVLLRIYNKMTKK